MFKNDSAATTENENLKQFLANSSIDIKLRLRLNKIFEQQSPITHLDFRGYEHGKKLAVDKEDLLVLLNICNLVKNTLKELIILGPTLDDESASLISGVLPSLSALTAFYLNAGQVGTSGIHAITEQFKKLQQLSTVLLHGDNIDDDAVADITSHIRSVPQINTISIHSVSFGETGWTSILDLMETNISQFKQISIKCATVSEATCERLNKILSNSNIRVQGFSLQAKTIANIETILAGMRNCRYLTDIILVSHIDNPESVDQLHIDAELKKIIAEHLQISNIENSTERLIPKI